nr:hypothetical protein [uncultured Methanobrevibacter sp.]
MLLLILVVFIGIQAISAQENATEIIENEDIETIEENVIDNEPIANETQEKTNIAIEPVNTTAQY